MWSLAQNGSKNDWKDVDCDWVDHMYDLQNHLYWKHKEGNFLLTLYIVVCSCGAIANLFVLVAFVRTPKLRNLQNYFIVNLAVSDLLLCTVSAPVTLYLTMNLFWPLGNFTCQMMASIQATNMFVSCLTLVLIAMDRVLLTLCPIKWRLVAVAPIISYCTVWILSIIMAAPYSFAVSAEEMTTLEPWNLPFIDIILKVCHKDRPYVCIENSWNRLPFSQKSYTLTVLAIQYLLPVVALAYSYSQIGTTIWRRVKASTTVDENRRHSMRQRNRKALLLLLLLVIIYAAAWFPMNAYNVLNVLGLIEFSQYEYSFCHLTGMTSAFLNPIMYALVNESFRLAFISLLRPLFSPCTKYTVVSSLQG